MLVGKLDGLVEVNPAGGDKADQGGGNHGAEGDAGELQGALPFDRHLEGRGAGAATDGDLKHDQEEPGGDGPDGEAGRH